MEDTLKALHDAGGLTMTVAVLWQIGNGISMEDLKAELQDMKEDFIERLMQTEFGRKQLEVILKNISILTEDDTDGQSGEKTGCEEEAENIC